METNVDEKIQLSDIIEPDTDGAPNLEGNSKNLEAVEYKIENHEGNELLSNHPVEYEIVQPPSNNTQNIYLSNTVGPNSSGTANLIRNQNNLEAVEYEVNDTNITKTTTFKILYEHFKIKYPYVRISSNDIAFRTATRFCLAKLLGIPKVFKKGSKNDQYLDFENNTKFWTEVKNFVDYVPYYNLAQNESKMKMFKAYPEFFDRVISISIKKQGFFKNEEQVCKESVSDEKHIEILSNCLSMYKCQECTTIYTSEEGLNKHQKSHSKRNQDPFFTSINKPDNSNQQTSQPKQSLSQSCKEHLSNGIYSCQECFSAPLSEKALNKCQKSNTRIQDKFFTPITKMKQTKIDDDSKNLQTSQPSQLLSID